MPIRLHNIRIDIDAPDGAIARAAAGKLQLNPDRINRVRVVRRAVDSRKHRPFFVYTIDVAVAEGEDEYALAQRAVAAVVTEPETPTITLKSGRELMQGRPVIIGAGPAGLFAAYLLAQNGFRPLVIERGRNVEERAADISKFVFGGPLDTESNILFGLGGAGTWSDGKLVWNSSSPLAEFILHTFVECGAPAEILVEARPHIGTDILRAVTKNFAAQIEQLGGEFRFACRASMLHLREGRLCGVRAGGEVIDADAVILAAGHSARDTVRTLVDQGVAIAARPFQIGVRIEHPQALINRSQYGQWAGHPKLPTAEYSLMHKPHGGWRSVHSFCMCPGGVIVPAVNSHGEICTNGMSRRARDGEFANSALIVPVSPEDFGSGRLDGIAFQEEIERTAFRLTGSFAAPAQKASDFVADRLGGAPEKTSYPLGVVPAKFSELLPKPVYQSIVRALAMTFERAIRGFASDAGTVIGPETRVTSPVRILRDDVSRESISTPLLFPVGEGSGYAGGIVSSALDGLLTAKTIIERFTQAG